MEGYTVVQQGLAVPSQLGLLKPLCPTPQRLPGCSLVPALHWVVKFFPKGNPGTVRQTDLFLATGEHGVMVHSQPGKCPFPPLVFLVIQGQRRGAVLPSAGGAKTTNIQSWLFFSSFSKSTQNSVTPLWHTLQLSVNLLIYSVNLLSTYYVQALCWETRRPTAQSWS